MEKITQRIIKFRAWDREKNTWVNEGEDQLLLFLDGTLGNVDPSCWDGGCTTNEETNSKFELMQFTGLKDKNDAEIYEGDLMRQIPNGYEPREILEVFWDDQLNGFAMRNKDKNYQTPIMEKDYTVIGNIYEKPELLSK